MLKVISIFIGNILMNIPSFKMQTAQQPYNSPLSYLILVGRLFSRLFSVWICMLLIQLHPRVLSSERTSVRYDSRLAERLI